MAEDKKTIEEKVTEEKEKVTEKKETEKKAEEKKPAEKKPAAKKTSTKAETEKKPAAKKTETKTAAEKKPAAKKTAEKKASEKKPAAKKTSTKAETEKKPASKKTVEKKADKVAKETAKEAEAVKKEEVKAEAKTEAALHPTLQKKKEAREAKAARKAANMVEEKKSRPNNILLAILIFGILIGMFAFIGGYNYFQKSASIEKYIEENNMAEMYGDFAYDENTQVKMKAEGNTVKVVMKVAEDAPKEAVEQFEGEDGTKKLKDIGAYFLTTFKPETRGFGGTVKVAAKQGDKTINYVKMSYREAKKFVKDLLEESQAEAENDDKAAEEKTE